MDVGEIVPTVDEAADLITQGKGIIDRIEDAHPPGGESTHTYPHINYTTASGKKGTVRVQAPPEPR